MTALVAVLAGGAGTRIGGAKAVRQLRGRPLIDYALDAAREAELETVILAKSDTPLPPLRERVVEEPDEPRHPLCGALAALDFARGLTPAPAVVLVACDMPFLTGALLRRLAELDGAALARAGGRVQSLPARCTVEHADALAAALAAESSLRRAFAALSPAILDEAELARLADPRRACFSVNADADIALAERWLDEREQPPPSSGAPASAGLGG